MEQTPGERPRPPWAWIDHMLRAAGGALARAGIYADAGHDYRSVQIDCPLCGGAKTVRACYAGKRRRVRLTCSTEDCINYLEDLK